MSLIKWEPFREIERFFDDDIYPVLARRHGRKNCCGWDLAVDVYEDDNKVVAKMNIPGIDPDKLDIEVRDGYLQISGSREERDEQKEKDYYSREIRYGSFERLVRLPVAVEEEKAEADYKDGVLEITMPKKEQQAGEKVKIKIKK